MEELRKLDTAPPRPMVYEKFKAKCSMGVAGVAASEGTMFCDGTAGKTRFEAFGGWSITRGDLQIQCQHFVKANPPECKLHEEPVQSFTPPEDAEFDGMQVVDGKDCQKWTYKMRSKAALFHAESWIHMGGNGMVGTPVLIRQKTPTQTIEMRFLELEPMDEFADDIFAIEAWIPAERPAVVSVKGVMTNKEGERVHGVSICASHPNNKKAAWTTRTGSQSDDKGEYELMLTPGECWRLTVQGAPKYGARIFEITPPEEGIELGGAADVVMEPATGGQAAIGNPGATGAPYAATTATVGGGQMGGAHANAQPGQYAMPPGYSTNTMSMEEMQAAQLRQQQAMANAHAAMGQSAAIMAQAGNTMNAMGMQGHAHQFHHGSNRMAQGQDQIAMNAMIQQQRMAAAQPAMQFHAQAMAAQQAQQQQQPPAQPAPQPAPAQPAPQPKAEEAPKAEPEAKEAPAAAATEEKKEEAASPKHVDPSPTKEEPKKDEEAPKAAEPEKPAEKPAEPKTEEPVKTEETKKEEPAKAEEPKPEEKSRDLPPAAAAPAPPVNLGDKAALATAIAQRLTLSAEKFAVGRQGFMANWKKRHFETMGTVITYHEKEGGPAKSTIALTKDTCKVIRNPTTTDHKEAKQTEKDLIVEFQETGKKLQLLMRFANSDEKNKWADRMDQIHAYVNA